MIAFTCPKAYVNRPPCLPVCCGQQTTSLGAAPDTLATVSNQASLSIVIPVGPDETAHLQLLQSLSGFPVNQLHGPVQIVVSSCETKAPAPHFFAPQGIPCLRVSGPAGRSGQLNRGIAASSGRCLWLLHADSRPTAEAMARAAEFARTWNHPCRMGALGWFPLAFAADGPRLAALNAAGANLRSAMLGLPFGDQAWLLRRDTFDMLGGFDEQFGRGEDLDFVRRARRAGIRLSRQNATITTSARRYRRHGWLRTTLAHLWLTLRLWLKSARKLGNPLT